jgi:hypothetical protein
MFLACRVSEGLRNVYRTDAKGSMFGGLGTTDLYTSLEHKRDGDAASGMHSEYAHR